MQDTGQQDTRGRKECALNMEAGRNQLGYPTTDAQVQFDLQLLRNGGSIIVACPDCAFTSRTSHSLVIEMADDKFVVSTA